MKELGNNIKNLEKEVKVVAKFVKFVQKKSLFLSVDPIYGRRFKNFMQKEKSLKKLR